MFRVTLLLLYFLALPVVGQNALPSLSADQVRAMQERGEIVLIDIRQPEEWRETGVAQDAVRISMLHPEGLDGFLRDVMAAVDGNPSVPVALICRTGNRTSEVVPVLQQRGFSRIFHIPEGMLGSQFGPGWIQSGLPVEDCSSC